MPPASPGGMASGATSPAGRLNIFMTPIWALRDELPLLLPRLVAALALLLSFWAVAAVLATALVRLGGRRGLDPDLAAFGARVTRLALVVFGTVTALGTAGVDVGALVAGLGLTGFAMGFAFKDIISNLLAGVLLLLYRPFRRGDRVEVAGSAGVVRMIDLRYTRLESDDGVAILVPNATLFTNSVRVERPRVGPRALE